MAESYSPPHSGMLFRWLSSCSFDFLCAHDDDERCTMNNENTEREGGGEMLRQSFRRRSDHVSHNKFMDVERRILQRKSLLMQNCAGLQTLFREIQQNIRLILLRPPSPPFPTCKTFQFNAEISMRDINQEARREIESTMLVKRFICCAMEKCCLTRE